MTTVPIDKSHWDKRLHYLLLVVYISSKLSDAYTRFLYFIEEVEHVDIYL